MPKRHSFSNDARLAIEWLLMLAILLLIVHAWLAKPCVVMSGSMAPPLLGQHRAVVCSDCGIRFAVGSQPGSEPLWIEARAICSNCGSAANPLADLPDAPGDGLLVFRGAFDWRPPRRWEQVVFRGLTDDGRLAVKRIVGLPGETIQLVDGNVIVDGQIARKPLAAQRAMAILVNDDRYRPLMAQQGNGVRKGTAEDTVTTESIRTSCWRPRDEHTRAWTLEPGEFRYRSLVDATSTAPHAIDWIDFHPPQRRSDTQESATATSAGIDDHYAYNQARPILELHPVNELLLRCKLRVSGDGGMIFLLANNGNHVFEVSLFMHKRSAKLSIDGAHVFTSDVPHSISTNLVRCEISTIDRQFLCAIDGEPLVPPFELPENLPINSQASLRRSAEGWFSIGAASASVDVQSAQVLRDIYYTRLPAGYAAGSDQQGSWRVGDDELFVLGDNSPFSLDSRVAPNVALTHLVGQPLVVWAPRRAIVRRGHQWNLLEPGRVRLAR